MTALLVRTQSGAAYMIAGQFVARMTGAIVRGLDEQHMCGTLQATRYNPIAVGNRFAWQTAAGDRVHTSQIASVQELSREV